MLFYALLSTALAGGLYLLLLFVLCAAGVIGFKYAQLWLRKNNNEKPKESEPKPAEEKKQDAEKKPAESKPKAVYYIVEKKRARAKPSYSEPKKIKFE